MNITKETISKIKQRLEWATQTIQQYNKHEQSYELRDAILDIKEAIATLKIEVTE